MSLEMLAEAQLLMNHLADANRLQQLLDRSRAVNWGYWEYKYSMSVALKINPF